MEKLGQQHLSFSPDFKEIVLISENTEAPSRWSLDVLHQSLCIRMVNNKFDLRYATDFDQATQQFDISNESRILFNEKLLSGFGMLIPDEDCSPIHAKVTYDLRHSILAIKYEPGPFPLHVYVVEGSFELIPKPVKRQG